MKHPTQPCIDCGKSILTRTAPFREGRCIDCDRKSRGVYLEHVRSCDETDEEPEDTRDYDASRRRLIDKWAPVLRSLEAWDEHERPVPEFEPASIEDRAILEIYRQRIGTPPLRFDGGHITICWLSTLAKQAAREAWGPRQDHFVMLTPSARSRWDDLHDEPDGDLWWLWSTIRGLRVETEPCHVFEALDQSFHVPAGCAPWTVNSYEYTNPLGAHGATEAWFWDGLEAHSGGVTERWIS